MSNAEIAANLKVAEATVKRHLANACEKMGVGSRGEAVSRAVAWGLLDPWDLLSRDAGAERPGLGGRYRCVDEYCLCEVVVTRATSAAASWRPPECHGREMEQGWPPQV